MDSEFWAASIRFGSILGKLVGIRHLSFTDARGACTHLIIKAVETFPVFWSSARPFPAERGLSVSSATFKLMSCRTFSVSTFKSLCLDDDTICDFMHCMIWPSLSSSAGQKGLFRW